LQEQVVHPVRGTIKQPAQYFLHEGQQNYPTTKFTKLPKYILGEPTQFAAESYVERRIQTAEDMTCIQTLLITLSDQRTIPEEKNRIRLVNLTFCPIDFKG
jgi:hypothetical protein